MIKRKNEIYELIFIRYVTPFLNCHDRLISNLIYSPPYHRLVKLSNETVSTAWVT